MKKEIIKKRACQVIKSEANSISMLRSYVDDDFAEVVTLILQSKGRVIITGIGKSAIIATKIVATLNSTGTPAIFMHAADAIHGDLGIIQENDTIICISKSGSTPEIKVLVPLIKNMGNVLVAMVSSPDSYLGVEADFVLRSTVEQEACPLNLAPTNSTTAQLVLGDALAVCLLEGRGFTADDFAKSHPGGALGKKLYTRVVDLMMKENPPKVYPETILSEVLVEMSFKRMGAVGVIDKEDKLQGIITDGDLRRMLGKSLDVGALVAQDVMSRAPKTTNPEELAIEAYNIMEQYSITQLAVTDQKGTYLGLIHLHDILKEGIV